MTTAELSLAILALLATPGPTNTLMFLAGAERGAIRALRLIPAEAAGYLATVAPLSLLGAHLLGSAPRAQAAVAVLAGLWVLVLALRLWRLPGAGARPQAVDARGVAVTTLLNPKALIFGLVLVPSAAGTGATLANLAGFTALVALVAVLWILAGAMVARHAAAGGADRMPILRRAAALWLAALSVALVLRGAGLA